jgi:hypothetical protein
LYPKELAVFFPSYFVDHHPESFTITPRTAPVFPGVSVQIGAFAQFSHALYVAGNASLTRGCFDLDNHNYVAVFEGDIYYFASIEWGKSDKPQKNAENLTLLISRRESVLIRPYPLWHHGEKRANAITLETGPGHRRLLFEKPPGLRIGQTSPRSVALMALERMIVSVAPHGFGLGFSA